MMLKEGGAVLSSGYLLQIALLLEVNWQFIREFDHFVDSRVFLEHFLTFRVQIQEIFALINQAKKIVAFNKILLGQLNHSITFIFKFTLNTVDGFNGNFFWW